MKFTAKQPHVFIIVVGVLRNSVQRSQMSTGYKCVRRATAVRRTRAKSASAAHNRLPSVSHTLRNAAALRWSPRSVRRRPASQEATDPPRRTPPTCQRAFDSLPGRPDGGKTLGAPAGLVAIGVVQFRRAVASYTRARDERPTPYESIICSDTVRRTPTRIVATTR